MRKSRRDAMFIEESSLFIHGSPFMGERRSVSLLRRRIRRESRRDAMFIEESSLFIHRSPFMGERRSVSHLRSFDLRSGVVFYKDHIPNPHYS